MTIKKNHPGAVLGGWIRNRRRDLKLNPSFVANEIKLSHAAYAEVELGITHWLGNLQANLLCRVLKMDTPMDREFRKMLGKASEVEGVQFADVFRVQDLAPVRLRTLDKFKAPTKKEADQLLTAVFQPLA